MVGKVIDNEDAGILDLLTNKVTKGGDTVFTPLSIGTLANFPLDIICNNRKAFRLEDAPTPDTCPALSFYERADNVPGGDLGQVRFIAKDGTLISRVRSIANALLMDISPANLYSPNFVFQDGLLRIKKAGTTFQFSLDTTAITANTTWTLPPNATGVLNNNGSGLLTWTTASSLPSGGTSGQALVLSGSTPTWTTIRTLNNSGQVADSVYVASSPTASGWSQIPKCTRFVTGQPEYLMANCQTTFATYTTLGTVYTMIYNTIQDSRNHGYSITTGVYTVTNAGLFSVTAGARWLNAIGYMEIVRNTTRVGYVEHHGVSRNGHYQLTAQFLAGAGDTINIRCQLDAGSINIDFNDILQIALLQWT